MIHTLNENSVYLVSANKTKDKINSKPMTAVDFKNQVLPYKTKLFRFALSYLKSIEDAKDVVQEVLIKAWEYLSNKGEIRQIEAWCMTAVKNKCLDWMKRKGYRTVEIENQFDLEVEGDSPYDKVDVNDALTKVKKLISKLPEMQQKILKLRDIEGESYKGIAEVLKIDIGLVKINIFRARRFIKDEMTKIDSYGI